MRALYEPHGQNHVCRMKRSLKAVTPTSCLLWAKGLGILMRLMLSTIRRGRSEGV